MQDNNPIPQIDNPTQRIFDRTFKLGIDTKSVTDLLDTAMGPDREPNLFFSNMNRADPKRLSSSINKMSKYSGAEETRNLINALSNKGLLSQHMSSSLMGLANTGEGAFFYDAGKRSLFFGDPSTGRFSALPIQGIKSDVVTMGHTTRSVNTLGVIGTNQRLQNYTFADAYYSSLAERLGVGVDKSESLFRVLDRDILKSRVGQIGQQHTKLKGTLNLDAPIVFFDLETNGLQGEILNVAAIRLEKGPDGKVIRKVFNRYSPYQGAVNQEALKIHKLSPEVLAGKANLAPFQAYASDLHDFFKGAIVSGYNVKGYDIGLVNRELSRAGINSTIGSKGVIDVFDLYKMFGKEHMGAKLTGAFKYYTGQEFIGHMAMADVGAALTMFQFQVGTHKALQGASITQIAEEMKTGGYKLKKNSGPSLKSLLGSGQYSRGVKSRVSARTAGLQQIVAGGPNTELFDVINKYGEAKAALTAITKTSGRYIPANFGSTIGEAYGRIDSAFNAFNESLPRIFDTLGVGGLWPLGKAENMLRAGRVVIPTAQAGDIYGTKFGDAAYSKGLPVYKRSATSAASAKRINRLGDSSLRSYLTKGAYDAGVDFQHQGFGINVGVIDFDSTVNARAVLGDSGALFSKRGSYKMGSTLHTHQVVIKSPGDATVSAIESLFKLNLASGDLNDLNRVIPFNSKDIRTSLKKGATLNDKEKLIKDILKHKSGRNSFKSAVKNRSRLNSISMSDGSMILNFISASPGTPGSLEMEVGARRLTGVKYLRTNRLAKMLDASTRGSKVDMFISAEDFAKTHGPQVYLHQFFHVLQREGMVQEAASVALPGASPVRLPGRMDFARLMIIDNEAEAYENAKNVVKAMMDSGGAKAKIGEEIERGSNILKYTHQLEKFGVKGITMFTLPGGIRSDFMMDINATKAARITPSKMRNLALSSKMFGFEDPYQDIIFKTYAQGWKGRDIGINAKTMDFMLNDTHLAKQYAKSLIGTHTPTEAKVIKLTQDGLKIGDRSLKALPDVARMRYTQDSGGPGIAFKELEDTLLDKKLGKRSGMLWLDIGENQESRSLVEGLAATRSRYIPLPLKYLRTDRGEGGRLIVPKNNLAYNYVRAMNILEANPEILLNPGSEMYHSAKSKELRNEFFELMKVGNTKTVAKLAGKKGLFENQNTILSPFSFRARLIPDRTGTKLNSASDLDKVFQIDVGRQELEEVLYRRYHLDKKLLDSGGWNPGNSQNTIKSLNRDGFAYAMITADPMQRPEHSQLVKMRVVDTLKRDAKYGQVNVHANQMLLSMLERDTDRDAISLHLIENLTDPKDKAAFESRIAAQKENFRMFRWVHMADNQAFKGGSPFGALTGAVDKKMTEFFGQKSLAHLGYSFARPIDGFMYGLASGDSSGFKMGDAPAEIIERVIAPFKGNSQRAAIAETLVQNLYQGGVAKGQAKTGLIEITKDIMGVADRAKQTYNATKVFDVQAIALESEGYFERFLIGQKNRAFMTARYLLEQSGMDDRAISRIEESLVRGAPLATEAPELAKVMIKQTAKLLGERYGVGHAFASTFNVNVNNVAGVISADRGSLKERPITAVNKVIGALAGERAHMDSFMAEATMGQEVRATAAEVEKAFSMDKVTSKVTSFFEHPGTAKAFGYGAVAGALGYAAFSSLITPDVSSSNDYGPQQSLSQMNRARAYGPGMQMAAAPGNPASITSIGRFNPNRTQKLDVSLVDNTRAFDPRLAQLQMKRLANSDYAY